MVTRSLSLSVLVVALTGCFLLPGYGGPTSPPPLQLVSGSQTLQVEPYTTCWSGGGSGYCADGFPADPLPDLGRVSGVVTVTFPVDGWNLEATTEPVGKGRHEPTELRLEQTSEQTWSMSLDVPPGTYEVDLSGRGPQGDIAAAFQLTAAKRSGDS